MEQIGLISKLGADLNVAYKSHDIAINTKESKTNSYDIKSIATDMEQIGESQNPHIIITAERLMLRHEAQFYGKANPQALKSINEAVKELDGASKALNIVQDKDKYQAVNDAHSPKDKDRKNGLPKDAFHVFTNSHKTRLGNRMRSIEASFEERLLLKERYNNMQVAQKEYMILQAKVLDIPLPEKSRQIEK